MKKLFFTLACAFATTFISAHDVSYSTALKNAKDYESKNQYAYALGSYYDALISSEPDENKTEAFKGYTKLCENIKKGLPGNDSYNAFQLHNEWKNLLLDAEKYGSEYGRFEFQISPLEQGALDFSSNTATYMAEIKLTDSCRYNKTIGIIEQGYKVAYDENQRSQWKDLPKPKENDYYHDGWPYISASVPSKNYCPDGAALFGDTQFDSSWSSRQGKYITTESSCTIYNAWTATFYNTNYETNYYASFYNMNLALVDDSNGKQLCNPARVDFISNSENNSGYATKAYFTNLDSKAMSLIDSNKAHVKVLNLSLVYGKKESDGAISGGDMEIKNPSITYLWDTAKNHERISFDNAYCIQLYPEQMKIAETFNDFVTLFDGKKGFAISKIPVTLGLFESIVGEVNKNTYTSYYDSESQTDFVIPLWPAKVSLKNACTFCNMLSLKNGLTPVYKFISNNYGGYWDVAYDPKADGYRLPTEEEWDFAHNEGAYRTHFTFSGTNDSSNVISEINTPVASAKPNRIGIYDMDSFEEKYFYSPVMEVNPDEDIYETSGNVFYVARNLSKEELKKAKAESEKISSRPYDLVNELIESELDNIINSKYQRIEINDCIYEISKEIPLKDTVLSYLEPFYNLDDDTETKFYYILNKASLKDNLEPVYSLNGETNPEKWIDDSVYSYDYEENKKASGYRIATYEEAKALIGSYYGSQKFAIRYNDRETKKLAIKKAAEKDKLVSDMVSKIRSANYTPKIANGCYTLVTGNVNVSDSLLKDYEPFKSFKNNEVISYYILNKASLESGYTPAYSYEGETDPDKWPVESLTPYKFEKIKNAGYYHDGIGSSTTSTKVSFVDSAITDEIFAVENEKRDTVIHNLVHIITTTRYTGINHDGNFTMTADNVVVCSTDLVQYEPFKTYSNVVVSSYHVLNKASLKMGLTPVYSYNGESNPDNWPISKLSTSSFKEDKTASGYRRASTRNSNNDTITYYDQAEQEKYERKAAEEKSTLEKEKKNLSSKFAGNVLNATYTVSFDPYSKKYFLISTNVVEVYSRMLNNKLSKSYKTEDTIKYVLNLASVEMGYKPVYSAGNETNPDKWNLARYRLEEDEEADGYRLGNLSQHNLAGLKSTDTSFAITRFDDRAAAKIRRENAAKGKAFLDSIGLTVSVSKTQSVTLWEKGGKKNDTSASQYKLFSLIPEKKSAALKSGFKNEDLIVIDGSGKRAGNQTTKIILDSKTIDLTCFGINASLEDVYGAFVTASQAQKVIVQVRRKSMGSYDLKEITLKK